MLQDDRVMSILTGVIIVAVMATFLERSEDFSDFLFGEGVKPIAPVNDEITLIAGESRLIDVLANDQNVIPADRDNIEIVIAPSCGAAEVNAGRVLYVPGDKCAGAQPFAYCVRRGESCAFASVSILMLEQPRPPTTRTARRPEAPPRAASPEPAAQPALSRDPAGAGQGDSLRDAQVAASIRPVAPGLATNPSPAGRVIETVIDDDGGAAPNAGQGAAPKLGAGPGVLDASITQEAALIDAPAAPATGGAAFAPKIAAASPGAQWRPGAAPDLSNLLDAAPEVAAAAEDVQEDIELAAATTEAEDESSRARAAQAEAERLVEEAAAAAPACPAGLLLSAPDQGGVSRIEISDPCRAGQSYAIRHAGLAFGGQLDQSGAGRLDLPVLALEDEVVAVFEDGSELRARLAVDAADMRRAHRVAVAWTEAVDLDLHAFEYAATVGDQGHVWAENPRAFRKVRRRGGGYLTRFEANAAGAQSIEIYTFWASRRAKPGLMRIALDHASRGDVAREPFCGGGALAAPSYEILHALGGAIDARRTGRMNAADCGLRLGAVERFATGAQTGLVIEN